MGCVLSVYNEQSLPFSVGEFGSWASLADVVGLVLVRSCYVTKRSQEKPECILSTTSMAHVKEWMVEIGQI